MCIMSLLDHNQIMASLTVRNIPDNLLKTMRRAAREQHRSLNSQALEWLEQGARQQQSRTESSALMESIRINREAMYREFGSDSDSVRLIRAMRGRGQS